MSRRINDDFNAFCEFLSRYNLTTYTSIPQQIDSCKAMHKKLFGLLVFNAEFKAQGKYPDSIKFLEEMASDLLLSLFCVAQGMYKPAKLQIRCSMENFLKALIMIDTPSIIQEKSVYAIFDAAKTDSHFITQPGQTCVNLIHTDYATLCRTVHGDPNAMNPTSALSMLPQYNQALQQEVSSIYVRTIENCLGKMYFDYAAYGEDTVINEGGDITSHGYIYNNRSEFKDIYDGETVPEEYRVFEYPMQVRAKQSQQTRSEKHHGDPNR